MKNTKKNLFKKVTPVLTITSLLIAAPLLSIQIVQTQNQQDNVIEPLTIENTNSVSTENKLPISDEFSSDFSFEEYPRSIINNGKQLETFTVSGWTSHRTLTTIIVGIEDINFSDLSNYYNSAVLEYQLHDNVYNYESDTLLENEIVYGEIKADIEGNLYWAFDPWDIRGIDPNQEINLTMKVTLFQGINYDGDYSTDSLYVETSTGSYATKSEFVEVVESIDQITGRLRLINNYGDTEISSIKEVKIEDVKLTLFNEPGAEANLYDFVIDKDIYPDPTVIETLSVEYNQYEQLAQSINYIDISDGADVLEFKAEPEISSFQMSTGIDEFYLNMNFNNEDDIEFYSDDVTSEFGFWLTIGNEPIYIYSNKDDNNDDKYIDEETGYVITWETDQKTYINLKIDGILSDNITKLITFDGGVVRFNSNEEKTDYFHIGTDYDEANPQDPVSIESEAINSNNNSILLEYQTASATILYAYEEVFETIQVVITNYQKGSNGAYLKSVLYDRSNETSLQEIIIKSDGTYYFDKVDESGIYEVKTFSVNSYGEQTEVYTEDDSTITVEDVQETQEKQNKLLTGLIIMLVLVMSLGFFAIVLFYLQNKRHHPKPKDVNLTEEQKRATIEEISNK